MFGSGLFGAGLFGGGIATYGDAPTVIEIYDNDLNYKTSFQSGVGEYIRGSFILTENGCGQCFLEFSNIVSITQKDIIKIYLFGSALPIYTGVVRDIPIVGSTNGIFSYMALGLNDYFLRLNTGAYSEMNKTVGEILEYFVDNVITIYSPITKNASKIQSISTNLVSPEFFYMSIQEVLEVLKNIASSDGKEYLVGVDREGDFFFREREADTKATLVVGADGDYGITEYLPSYQREAVSKYYVINKAGDYIGAVTSSNSTIDISEAKLTAPELSDADALLWAEGILLQKDTQKKQATIDWDIERVSPIPLVADGQLRIISNVNIANLPSIPPVAFGSGIFGYGIFGGGNVEDNYSDDVLNVKQVTYTIDSERASRQIILGDLPIALDEQIGAINRKVLQLQANLGR